MKARKESDVRRVGLAILWNNGPAEGSRAAVFGRVAKMTLAAGKGTVRGERFTIKPGGAARLEVEIEAEYLGPGHNATRLEVRTKQRPFTLMVRDVDRTTPMYIPAYGVAVTEALIDTLTIGGLGIGFTGTTTALARRIAKCAMTSCGQFCMFSTTRSPGTVVRASGG